MKILAPGIFEVTLSDGPREVKISLGLKGEIYKHLIRKQLVYQQLSMKNLIEESDKTRISALAEEISLLAQSDDREKLDRVRKQLDEAYADAFARLEVKQKEFMHELALGKVQLTDDSIAETLAMLLSEYDMGKVVKEVTADEIRWSDKYFSCQDELMTFLDAVIDYLDTTLKKTPKFNRMLESLVESGKKTTT